MSLFQKLLRAGEGKKVKLLESIVPEVAKWEPEIERLGDDQLAAKTLEFRGRVQQGEDLDDLLPEAFAVVREAARRQLGQRHYDVQMMGGAALHFGWVAEMKTGEGKTLVATLPAYLNALTGRSVHLVTVNDYLAKRDAEWMGQIYNFLGMSVGVVIPGFQDSPAEKRAAYDCDIIHGTNNEFGFDYLRDNMCVTIEEQTQWGSRRVTRRAPFRDRRRGRLDPHRRGPHAAHHLGPGARRRRALLPVRSGRARLAARA